MSILDTIWGKTDVCAEQYRCATALHLMSVLSQRHSIISFWCISVPGHGKAVFGVLNAINK